MKIHLAAALSFGIVLSGACAPYALAASAPAHIQNLQGCFRVSYRFVEDGTRDYEIKDALEWITLKQQSGAYLIQYYGLIRTGEVVQHFTETWSSLQDGRWRQDVGPSRIHAFQRSGWGNCIAPHPARQNPLAIKERSTTCSTASPLFKSRQRGGFKAK